jgi:copper chaperone CopZ
MKSIILIVALFVFSFQARSQFVKAELQAAGLTCSMCSRAVDKQLQTLDFVDSVGINLSTATFILHFKKNKFIDFDLIKTKVEDAGFSVASLKAIYHFNHQQVDADYHLIYQNNMFHFIHLKPQILNGDVAFKILNKGFMGDKEFKKTATLIKNISPIPMDKMKGIKKVFHVSL